MRRSIHITFSDSAGATLVKGPFQRLVFQGETLREAMGGPLVAAHEDHHWLVDDKRFGRFDCDCSVLILLTREDGKRSRSYGPYASFSARDGITFADREVFAFADRSIGDWYCHADGLHWDVQIVEPTA